MFRRKEDTIEADMVFPAHLGVLGFFINNLGQFRMIGAPDKDYVYHSTNNERVNEMLREAMQECQRQEVEKRLSLLGINRIYLPEYTTIKPNGPHVPILAPAPEILQTRKRIIVVVNDAIQDIGVLAYRQLQRDLGVNGGSVINFVKKIIKRSATGDATEKYQNIFDDGFELEDHDDTPALVVLNTAQLLYSHKHNKALTMRSWSALPRKSIAHDMTKIHDVENRVQGHRDPKEHIKWVFDNVLHNPSRVAQDAQIYLIAIENGAENMLSILEEDFEKYSSRINAMAMIHSTMDVAQIKNPSLHAFLHQRSREWKYSDLTIDPHNCVALPEGYSSEDATSTDKIIGHISWAEDVPKSGPMSSITDALHRLIVGVTPAKKQEESLAVAPAADNDRWTSGDEALCPTFGGGSEPTVELVLTDPAVQDAVLSFFEEVAHDPNKYCNPSFKTYTKGPQPSPDNPLELDPDIPIEDFSATPEQMTLEQAELIVAKEDLERMQSALKACPDDVPVLKKGRDKLVSRIAVKLSEIEVMEQKALGTGALTAGEALETRGKWEQKALTTGAPTVGEAPEARGNLEQKALTTGTPTAIDASEAHETWEPEASTTDAPTAGEAPEAHETWEPQEPTTDAPTAGEAPVRSGNWEPKKEGKQVKFAGTTVDSELLKLAGLPLTAEQELEKLVDDDA